MTEGGASFHACRMFLFSECSPKQQSRCRMLGTEKQENGLFSNLQSVRLTHSFDLMLGTHLCAAESATKGGKSTAFGQDWQQIQEQCKPEKTILTPSQKGSLPLCPESFALTLQWGDAGH